MRSKPLKARFQQVSANQEWSEGILDPIEDLSGGMFMLFSPYPTDYISPYYFFGQRHKGKQNRQKVTCIRHLDVGLSHLSLGLIFHCSQLQGILFDTTPNSSPHTMDGGYLALL